MSSPAHPPVSAIMCRCPPPPRTPCPSPYCCGLQTPRCPGAPGSSPLTGLCSPRVPSSSRVRGHAGHRGTVTCICPLPLLIVTAGLPSCLVTPRARPHAACRTVVDLSGLLQTSHPPPPIPAGSHCLARPHPTPLAHASRTGVFVVKTESASFDIADVDVAPDFLSFGRDWSFFGTWECTTATEEALVGACPSTMNAQHARVGRRLHARHTPLLSLWARLCLRRRASVGHATSCIPRLMPRLHAVPSASDRPSLHRPRLCEPIRCLPHHRGP
jgi:hypothetical protein